MELDPAECLECWKRISMKRQVILPEVAQADANSWQRRELQFEYPKFDLARDRLKFNDKIWALIKHHRLKGCERALRQALNCSHESYQYWKISCERINRKGLGRAGGKITNLIRNTHAVIRLLDERQTTVLASVNVPTAFCCSPEAVSYALRRFIATFPRLERSKGDDSDRQGVPCSVRQLKPLAKNIDAMLRKLSDPQIRNRIDLGRAVITNEPLGLVVSMRKEDWQDHCVDASWIKSMLCEFMIALEASAEIDGTKLNVRQYAYKESVTAPLAGFWQVEHKKYPRAYAGECPFVNFLVDCFDIVGIPISRDALAGLDMSIVAQIWRTGRPQYWTPPRA